MPKRAYKGAAAAGALGVLLCATALAEEIEPRGEIQSLKERVERLEHDSGEEAPAGTLPQLEFGALLEVEAYSGKDFAGVSTSDITLATVELSADAHLTPLVSAQVSLLYEEGATPLELDQGVIAVANPERSPFALRAGQMYLPFGHFDSGHISDPLTLELGETRDTALEVGYSGGAVQGNIAIYNGTSDTGSDQLNHFGVGLDYDNGNGLALGASYLSSLADSNNLALGTVQHYAPGVSAYAQYAMDALRLSVEYLGAMQRFDAADLAYGGKGAKPATWTVEAGYDMSLAANTITVTAGIQGSDEALALSLPARRYLLTLSLPLGERTALSAQWSRDRDYDIGAGGTANRADTLTVQLAAEL